MAANNRFLFSFVFSTLTQTVDTEDKAVRLGKRETAIAPAVVCNKQGRYRGAANSHLQAGWKIWDENFNE